MAAMKRLLTVTAVVILSCLLGTAGGCGGSNRAAVKGKITIDGVPLPEGTIDFVPVDKSTGNTAGARVEKGDYAIRAEQGLFPGEYQVQVRADRPTSKKVWDGMGDDRAPASKKTLVEQMESYIPVRYNDRTELNAKIESGKVNVCDFDLQLGKK
jgi:hypothetical protein